MIGFPKSGHILIIHLATIGNRIQPVSTNYYLFCTTLSLHWLLIASGADTHTHTFAEISNSKKPDAHWPVAAARLV